VLLFAYRSDACLVEERLAELLQLRSHAQVFLDVTDRVVKEDSRPVTVSRRILKRDISLESYQANSGCIQFSIIC
jgi:hypothetical protein